MKRTPIDKTISLPQNIANPLIDNRSDTTQVSVALQFLAKTFIDSNPEGIELNFDECIGLASLLQTCSAALDAMNKPSFKDGGL